MNFLLSFINSDWVCVTIIIMFFGEQGMKIVFERFCHCSIIGIFYSFRVNWKKMGCEQSKLSKFESEDLSRSHSQNQQEEFKLNYRQFVMNSRGDVFQFYHLSNYIHRSAGSLIRKAYHRSSKQERVCKIVPLQNFNHLASLQEAEMLKSLDHPNIMTIHEYFIEKSHAYLIFESLAGCNLLEHLKRSRQIGLDKVISIMWQLLSVISMLKGQNIAHRAIHPGHIMLIPQKHPGSSSGEGLLVKLIDFSTAVWIDQKKYKPVRPYIDTYYNSLESKTHPLAHDMYCCGLIFMTLLGGMEYLANIRGQETENISLFIENSDHLINFKPLLLQMLNKNPLKRASPLDILNSEIFSMKSNMVNYEKTSIMFKNLLHFNIRGRLRSTLWMFATITLNQKNQRFQYLSQFYSLDKNKDGKIDLSELSEGLMMSLNISQKEAREQAHKIFKNLDKNNNGYLDFYQFVLGTFSMGKMLSDRELKIIFSEIDSNKDGFISEDELNEVVDGLDDYSLLDGQDRKLDYKRFKRVMESYIERLSEEKF